MNEKLIYINYWSKLRNNTDQEANYNKGRIATKIIFADEYIGPEGIYRKFDKLWSINYSLHKLLKDKQMKDLYNTFNIPKHSGGFRTITAPSDELKEIQKEVVKLFNEVKWLPSNNAHGFTKKRNCKSSLEVHQKHKSRWFLKIDIHDFFGSTTEEMIEKALEENAPFCKLNDTLRTYLTQIVTLNGVVPQGAPTSPTICNIVMNAYDYKIQRYCHKHGLIYTRYADDILISSRVDWDWQETLNAIQKMLDPYTIAENKVRYGSFNGRNWNLGIMYTNDYKLTVGHVRKHNLKCAVHNFCTKPDTQTSEEYYKLQGQLAYCRYIEPDYEWFSWAQIELTQFKPEPTLNTATEQSIVHHTAQTFDTELPFV